MSAEAWRRIGSDLAPLDLAWQAWLFQHLRLDLCGRCGTFGTSVDVRGSLATNWVGFGAAGSCVAGVTLSGRCGTFGTSIHVRGSLATNWVGFGAAGSCVAGVTLSAPQARFAWQAWYFRYLHRCPRKLGDELGRIWRRWIVRGRRGTFSTSGSMRVAGVVLWVPP